MRRAASLFGTAPWTAVGSGPLQRWSPATDRPAKLRAFYARCVTASRTARDPRIEQAFAAVPRETFAGPGPWSIPVAGGAYVETPDDDLAFLYSDVLIGIDPERGIHIGEPSLHASCLDALALRPGESVIHVGAGTGYYTAIIAHLVGPGGRVFAYEIDPDLAARAGRNLADLPWVELRARSGIEDRMPRVHAIYVNAGITQPSFAWLDALLPGGRLMFPLQGTGGFGGILLVERPTAGLAWPARFVSRAFFIPCQARQDAKTGPELTAAFRRGGWDTVRSFRLEDATDDTCWFAGDGWWLSTAEAVLTPAED